MSTYNWPSSLPTTGGILVILIAAAISSLHAQGNWQPANNGLYSGWIESFGFGRQGNVITSAGGKLYRRDESGHIWTATDTRMYLASFVTGPSGTMLATGYPYGLNLYRSTDDGMTWSVTADTPGYYNSVVFAPNGTAFALSGPSLHRSVDDGKSWQKLPGNSAETLSQILARPDGTLLESARDSIYRSTDNGDTWNRIATLEHLGGWTATREGTIIARGDSAGNIYRSTDMGQTWQWIDSIRSVSFSTASNGSVYTRSFSEDSSYDGKNGLYRSTDDGRTWKFILPAVEYVYVGPGFAIDPNDMLWAGVGRKVLRSSDNGSTWSDITAGLTNTSISQLVSDSSGIVYALIPSGLYVVRNGGPPMLPYSALFRTTDNGDSWKLLKDSLYDGSLTITRSGTVFAMASRPVRFATYDYLTYDVIRSTDHGDTWAPPIESIPIGMPVFNNGFGVANAGKDTIVVSTDDGLSWDVRSVPPDYYGYGQSRVTSHGVLLNGARDGNQTNQKCRLYRSLDTGRTWILQTDTLLSLGLLTGPNGIVFHNNNGKIYLSTDDGATWSKTLDPGYIYGVAYDSSGAIFLNVVANDRSMIYRSTNNGTTWTMLHGNATDITITSRSSYYVLSDSMIYHSLDGGATWNYDNGSMAGIDVVRLLANSRGYLFVATRADGAYRRELVSSSNVQPEKPEGERASLLEPNIPNPFSGSTTIRFTLPIAQHITLSVHDLLGREVATLVDGLMPAGRNEVKWNAEGVASGVYVVTLAGQSGIGTQVIVVR